MGTKIKVKFINNIWITGIFNNEEIIGRTVLINSEEKVVVVSETANVNIVLFSKINSICKINFIDKTKKQNSPIDRKSIYQLANININKIFNQN